MTRKIQSRVINSSPFIERRHSRRGSAAGQTPLRRETDGHERSRHSMSAGGDAAYPAFTGAARPHGERSALGRTIDLYA